MVNERALVHTLMKECTVKGAVVTYVACGVRESSAVLLGYTSVTGISWLLLTVFPKG
jgi:hypothetical protein